MTRGAVAVSIAIYDSIRSSGGGDYRRLPASSRSVDDLAMTTTPATRALDIVVRSAVATAVGPAAVWVLPGHWEIKNLDDLLGSPALAGGDLTPRPVGDSVPPTLAGKVRRDDLLKHLEHAPRGELTVCACSFPGEVDDPGGQQFLMAHLSDFALKCEHVGPDTPVVVLSVPPQRRFDEP